jgi:hypothetical protein
MKRKFSDDEYATARFAIKQSILQGLAETVPLHGMVYAEVTKPIVDTVVEAIYEKLAYWPRAWSLLAIGEKALLDGAEEGVG